MGLKSWTPAPLVFHSAFRAMHRNDFAVCLCHRDKDLRCWAQRVKCHCNALTSNESFDFFFTPVTQTESMNETWKSKISKVWQPHLQLMSNHCWWLRKWLQIGSDFTEIMLAGYLEQPMMSSPVSVSPFRPVFQSIHVNVCKCCLYYRPVVAPFRSKWPLVDWDLLLCFRSGDWRLTVWFVTTNSFFSP